jgi:tyrosyl-tRNA synthetase
MKNNCKQTKMEDILNSYNLTNIITFPTRVRPTSSTTIDNIFIDEQQLNAYEVYSEHNGISDHEAQLLIAQFPLPSTTKNEILVRRIINDQNMIEFKMKLSNEKWELIYKTNDTNTSFNQFLNTLLRYFYGSFPITKRHKHK